LTPLHDMRFPGESSTYRAVRDDLLKAEIELRRRAEAVARQRRELPLGGEVQTDYAFEEWDEASGARRTVRLSHLFADALDTLIVYSFMWVPPEQGLPFVGPCPSCTSIIDGIDGSLPHINRRTSFAVAAAAPIDSFRNHARSRGWRYAHLLSSRLDRYSRDYGAEDEHGFQWPLATVFVRRDGRIYHFWSSELWFASRDTGQDPRHVDFMWPIWAVFDRMPDGRDDFFPELEYS
jgi:predicted dithiol-disulfide oxidoreductase (DUF899 family)